MNGAATAPRPAPDGRPRVGWIGIGAMGLPLCKRLINAGCDVLAYDRLPDRLDQAVSAGAMRAASIRELAERCDTVFSMVYDDLAFDAVVTGVDGLLAGIRPDSLLVDLSTVSPQLSQEMSELLVRNDVRYLRAPVSGSVALAEAGEIAVLVSGDLKDMQACLPMLRLFSRTQSYQGAGEAARVVKLIVNAMVVGSTVLIGEALELGEAAGLPRANLVEAINQSIVGSRHYASRAEALKQRRYGGAGPVRMAAKDLDLAFALGGIDGLQLPVLHHARARVGAALEQGLSEAEVTVLAETLVTPGARGERTDPEAPTLRHRP